MREGEIVRTASGSFHRAFPSHYFPIPEPCEIVTVGELFAAAGFAVPGVVVGYGNYVNPRQWITRDSEGKGHHFGEGWIGHPTVPGREYLPHIDLSRLPALDAWDALPDVIKAVVK